MLGLGVLDYLFIHLTVCAQNLRLAIDAAFPSALLHVKFRPLGYT